MKDWSLVEIVIGVIIILGIGFFEQSYLSNLSTDMLNEVTEAEKLVHSGDINSGITKLQNIITKWEKNEKKLEIMINHGDIHKISESLTEIDSKLKDFFNSDNVSSNFALLKEYIINIKEGNEFTTGNVL